MAFLTEPSSCWQRKKRSPLPKHAGRTAIVVAITFVVLLPGMACGGGEGDPFAEPKNAGQLACNMSPSTNPARYMRWWNAVRDSSDFQLWFWNAIIPLKAHDPSCPDAATEVESVFWNNAVPENWVLLDSKIDEGWPWPTGGYYTQTLWLRAIPENWALAKNIGGWPWPTGGYYAQWFWLHAVPEDWAVVGDIGGWPSPTGGYYAQWFWLHAVPDNWAANDPSRTLGAGLYAGNPLLPSQAQGYYRYEFWQEFVPNNYASVPARTGWPWPTGGYYTQTFWLRAAPDAWARREPYSYAGASNRGYYDAWYYHFATTRDFAWSETRLLGGTPGAGYYDYWSLTSPMAGGSSPPLNHYTNLAQEARGYLARANVARPVNDWFDSDADVVVVMSFDHERNGDECTIANVLGQTPATFFIPGFIVDGLSADDTRCKAGQENGCRGWKKCLLSGPYEIGNHTNDHPGNSALMLGETPGSPQLFDTLRDGDQRIQIAKADEKIRSLFPNAAASSFRTPWTDAFKSFDYSVVRNLAGYERSGIREQAIQTDSSVAYVSQYQIDKQITPQKALFAMTVPAAYPFPFNMTVGSRTLTEVPFIYPSDCSGRLLHGLQPEAIVAGWKTSFDQIRAKHGVAAFLMHPWVLINEGMVPALADLLAYMKAASPNVRFTTMQEVSTRFRKAALAKGW